MAVPHPIPYQGSKRNLAPYILRYIPSDVTRLVEPFAGSAAVSLAAAAQGVVRQFLLNDINVPLIALWRSIIETPDTLARHYEYLWNAQLGRERRFYDLVRERFNRTHRPYYLLYLLARCVKAAVRYNMQGEFNQSPDNRRKGRRPAAMSRDILSASQLLVGGTTLRTQDYRAVLEQTTPKDLVYMDPPYQGVSITRDPRYIMSIDHDVFIKTLLTLNQRDIAYIVSYDGRTGSRIFGEQLPESLQLKRIELAAGRSSQATLLGRDMNTYESLYLSPSLVARLDPNTLQPAEQLIQLALFEDVP